MCFLSQYPSSPLGAPLSQPQSSPTGAGLKCVTVLIVCVCVGGVQVLLSRSRGWSLEQAGASIAQAMKKVSAVEQRNILSYQKYTPLLS